MNDLKETKEYKKIMRIYKGMVYRTTIDKPYHKYWYGKGIKICDEWLEEPEKFYLWNIQNGYKEGLTIDRIDSNGNYEPSNCQWITRSENSKKKKNRMQTPRKKTNKFGKGVRLELKIFREVYLGIKQEEMAKKLGISKQFYCYIENGYRNPTYTFLEKFDELFKDKYKDKYKNVFELFKIK